MTSSEKSTSGGEGEPQVAVALARPAVPGALTPKARQRLLVGGLATVPAVGGALALYGGAFTVGTLFLMIGWGSVVATGWLLYRAAVSFDVTPRDPLTAGYEGELSDRGRLDLEREKKILLKAIKEIDFDHEMGKIDDEDHAFVTGRYRARAVEIIRLLDENKPTDFALIAEKELAIRLAKAGVGEGAPVTAADTPVPAAPEPAAAPLAVAALRPEVSTEAVDTTCPSCTTRNDLDAIFCKKCGHRFKS